MPHASILRLAGRGQQWQTASGYPLYRLSICGPTRSVTTDAGFRMEVPCGLDEAVTVSDLAARAAMSPRTFARRFLASTGATPLAWLVRERIRLARRMLETSDSPIDVVARRSGFGSPDNLRKHFGRALGTSPQAYRRAFAGPAAVWNRESVMADGRKQHSFGKS